ncbi:MAG: hypothetical protein CM15mP106_7900 [Candidatus Neomarinimicrobiota bacterium]|nr:MAG: hypothetical protein CM15mP106_7900 [Candidatus Neomarinimicrobiota bacterium]
MGWERCFGSNITNNSNEISFEIFRQVGQNFQKNIFHAPENNLTQETEKLDLRRVIKKGVKNWGRGFYNGLVKWLMQTWLCWDWSWVNILLKGQKICGKKINAKCC